MLRIALRLIAAFGVITTMFSVAQAKDSPNMNDRSKDWKNGAVIYQIFLDRFAPPDNIEAKRNLYSPYARLRAFNELPKKGNLNEKAGLWSHELDFWGGDLSGLNSKISYLKDIGIGVVYLNPIFHAMSNHKYDTWDYMTIDPAYGTRSDLKALAGSLHANNMKLILDGVFNHMGRKSPMFEDAFANKHSRWRDFFVFTDKNDMGYKAWFDVANLPELDLDSPKVQDYVFRKKDSVMKSYLLNEDIDGWRLDVAFEFGFDLLGEITKSAHDAKNNSAVIAEVWNYPNGWTNVADGILNTHGGEIIFDLVTGKIGPARAARMWQKMIDDAGIEGILKSWLILDNHDRPRLVKLLPNPWQQQMTRMLQFALPGSPCIYYGSELGMTGGDDPENRAPMRWELAMDTNATLAEYKKLISLHKREPALTYGDFTALDTEKLFAFMRTTDSVRDTIIVVANPSDQPERELLQIPDGRIHNWSVFKDVNSNLEFRVKSALIDAEVPAHGFYVLKLNTDPSPKGYSSYRRMK